MYACMSWLVDGKRTHRNPCPPLVTNAPPALLRTVKKHTVTMGGMEDSRTEPCSNQGMGSVQNLVRNEACTTEEFPQKILPAINDACHPSVRNVVCRGPVGVRSQQPSRLQMELVKSRAPLLSSLRTDIALQGNRLSRSRVCPGSLGSSTGFVSVAQELFFL